MRCAKRALRLCFSWPSRDIVVRSVTYRIVYFKTDRSYNIVMRNRKGEATREWIVAKTAALLNREGYLRAPVSEIMRATGLQKGGIYNHFSSRQALTLEAFEFAAAVMRDRVRAIVTGGGNPKDQLRALVQVFRDAPRTALAGGCPIANLAIESDDADPDLRAAARSAMGGLIGAFEKVIAAGTARGEFGQTDARACAIYFVSALEGAYLLSNLYKDPVYLESVATRLEREVAAGLR